MAPLCFSGWLDWVFDVRRLENEWLYGSKCNCGVLVIIERTREKASKPLRLLASNAGETSLAPAVLQPHREVKHRLVHRVVDPISHKVPMPFKLELIVRLGIGQ